MGKTAYFDCFAGVSGDMVLGALLDAGLKAGELREALRGVPLRGWRLDVRRVKRGGLSGTKATVLAGPRAGKGLRGLDAVLRVVRRSALPAGVRRRAGEAFSLLARAEARVHGGRPAEAHFHEVGAVDSLVDVLGSLAGLHLLGVGRVVASALPWSSGSVACAHGTLPVPAPAAAELLRGVPVVPSAATSETVTPTGIAILRSCAATFGSPPAMRVDRIGYGAGEERSGGLPNLLRVVLGGAERGADPGLVTVVETGIDDMPPVRYEYLMRRLLGGGALDAFVTPVLMKKGRPGHLLTVLCAPPDAESMAGILFEESTTLGVRMREERRMVLPRMTVEAETRYGRVRVKLARRPGGRVTAMPEYDDCAAAAGRNGVPLGEVAAEAGRLAARGVRGGKRSARQGGDPPWPR